MTLHACGCAFVVQLQLCTNWRLCCFMCVLALAFCTGAQRLLQLNSAQSWTKTMLTFRVCAGPVLKHEARSLTDVRAYVLL